MEEINFEKEFPKRKLIHNLNSMAAYRYRDLYNKWFANPSTFRYSETFGAHCVETSCGNLTGRKFFPEQCYNRIKPLGKLKGAEGLTSATFKVKANKLKYDDLGINVKNGYIRDEGRWQQVDYLGGKNRKSHFIVPKDFSDDISCSNKFMNMDLKDLPLMIDLTKIGSEIKNPLDLIYGKTISSKLKKASRRPYASWTYFDPYTKKYERSRSNYAHWCYSGIKFKNKKGALRELDFESLQVKKTDYPTSIKMKFYEESRKYKKQITFKEVTWVSRRQSKVAVVPGSYRLVDAFTTIRVRDADYNDRYYSNRGIIVDEYENRVFNSYQSIERRYIESCNVLAPNRQRDNRRWGNRPMSPMPMTVGYDKYHIQNNNKGIFKENASDYTKIEDSKTMPFPFDKSHNDHLKVNKINHLISDFYNSASLENINYVVLTSILVSRIEVLAISHPFDLFNSKAMIEKDGVKVENISLDVGFFLPEITTLGKSMLLKMMKKTIAMNMTIRPSWVYNASIPVSDIHVEECEYMAYWLVHLYIHCERESLKDLDYYPYFVDRAKDENGVVIPTIRLDIGRGDKCKFIVPELNLLGSPYNLKGYSKDELMVALDRYLQVLAPLISDMEKEGLVALNYCYPVVDVVKKLYPRLYNTFSSQDIPSLKDGLEIDVKVNLIKKVIEYLKDVVLKDETHEFHPVSFQRRVTFKQLGIWNDVKKLDFSKTSLPKLNDTKLGSPANYEVLREGKYESLKTIPVGDKLLMLQNVTDLISGIDPKKEDVIQAIHEKYILPIVESIKLDNNMSEKEVSDRIEDMLVVKSKLDYMRDVELSYLRKRKETLVALFDSQRNTLSRILIEDKQAQDAFLSSLVLMNPKRELLKYTDIKDLQVDNEVIDDIMEEHEKIENSRNVKTKLGWTMLTGFTAGSLIGAVFKALKKRKEK